MVILNTKTNKNNAFTIVELLMVIVIIGILAAMVIISYTGISDKAITAGLKSDLSSASNFLKMYNVEYGIYPSSLDSEYCPSAPIVDSNYCLKFSPGTTATYVGGAQSFQVIATKLGQYYSISESTGPAVFTPTPAIPTMIVEVNNSDVVADINSSSDCIKGTIQYGIRSRVNDGAWGDYSEWSNISSVTAVAVDDVKYSFQARARCYVNSDEYSSIVIGAEYNNAKMTAPLAPSSITANTVGNSTTWNWTAVTCVNGVTNYQYSYTISPAGFDSGWTDNGNGNSVIFTTSTGGQTYNVQVRARCSGTYATSEWSSTVSASYYRPSAPILAGCDASNVTSFSATLCANITSQGDAVVNDSGICWGVTPNPTTNCMSFYSSSLTYNNFSGSVGVQAVASSPDGINVYTGVSGASGNGVYVYNRNTSTGALTYSTMLGSTNVQAVAVSQDGKNVYTGASGASGNGVYVYNRNTSTGALTYSTMLGSTGVYGIDISPDGKNVYAAVSGASGNGVYVYNRNTSTGALTYSTMLGSTGAEAVVVSLDGKSVYAGVSGASGNGVYIYDRNVSTGALTYSTMSGSTGVCGIDISPDGKNIYTGASGASGNGVYIYTRTKLSTTGSFSQLRSGFPSGTTIYFRAYAANSIGMNYASDSTFTTL